MSKPKNQMRYLNVDRYLLKKQPIVVDDIIHLEMKMKSIIDQKLSGLSFSPYLEGQDPSQKSKVNQQQIADRLEIIRPYTEWVRTFSTTNGNEEVPRIAHEKKLKTLVGAWIDDNEENNEIEIANIIELAKAGYADLIAIGNEVLLREDLEVEQLIEYIKRVKAAVPNIPVGYVDAYYTFVNYPEIVEVCDVIYANCYPFWEYCSIDIAVEYMKKMYELAVSSSQGKPVIISETGWPTKGESYGGAVPSYINAMNYFIQSFTWAKQENILMFYFSSFDEVWKMSQEGEYGAYWGIWDKDGHYKFNQTSKK